MISKSIRKENGDLGFRTYISDATIDIAKFFEAKKAGRVSTIIKYVALRSHVSAQVSF